MSDDDNPNWLLNVLQETQLEQFYVRLRDELQITRLSHFDHVEAEDLEKIGMGRPGARRLLEAVKKKRTKQKSKVNLVNKLILGTAAANTYAAKAGKSHQGASNGRKSGDGNDLPTSTGITCLINQKVGYKFLSVHHDYRFRKSLSSFSPF